jgi:uncharacterized protein
MYIFDVNILLYAYDASSPHHKACSTWLNNALSESEVRVPTVVLSGFLRIATNKKIFPEASLQLAIQFIEVLEQQPGFDVVHSSRAHWHCFKDLCKKYKAQGNDVTDLYIAAFALEYDATLVSVDADFARVKPLKWLNPVVRA